MDLPPDWKEFLASLNSNRIRYLIVGAIAMAKHGTVRFTGDIDIWVADDEPNLEALTQMIETFGFKLREPGHPSPFLGRAKIVHLGQPPFRIDVMTAIAGVGFEEAWAARVPGALGGVEVNFISADLMIRNKRSTGRAKDASDAAALEEHRRGPSA